MKVSGFTFVRNVVKYDYPVMESIRSILPVIQEAMRRHLGNPEVKGLLFRYLHFIADYWSTNPWFYHKAARIIRNNGEVESCGDAVGFHLKATQQYLQSGPKEWIAPSGGRAFHYGWVMDLKTMLAKVKEQITVYHGATPPCIRRTLSSMRTMQY